MSYAKFVLGAVAVTGLLSAISAQAFTYDSRTNQNSDGTARFQDPEDALMSSAAGKSDDSKFSIKFSGSNGPASNGYDSRFVPSSNGVFSSPFAGPSNMDLALGNRH